jgi:hypothetical protein
MFLGEQQAVICVSSQGLASFHTGCLLLSICPSSHTKLLTGLIIQVGLSFKIKVYVILLKVPGTCLA